MSSNNRTTPRGGKGAKNDKSQKIDKIDTGKGSGEKQQAGAGGDHVRSKSLDPVLKDKVSQIMEMTKLTEPEVCLALHYCDNDVEKAVNMIYEEKVQSDWETTVKKKKNRQASTSKPESTEIPTNDWNEELDTEKEKPRNKSGGPPRLHGRHNDSRGWRGREKQENERNLEDGGRQDHRDRRGRSGGPIRGGSGRGRGGGRAGGRHPPRNNRSNFNNSRPIETWDNSWDPNSNANHDEPNWDEGPGIDEWSAEEYTGSLADSKVFTPSVPTEIPKESEILSRSPIPEERIQLPPQQNQMPSQSPVPLVGTLNAAQTQYLNQLTQQNTDMKTTHLTNQSYGGNTTAQGSQVYSNAQYGSTPSNTYVSSGYTAANVAYGTVSEALPVQQPARPKTQRARVPPPSKIPSSAVEMPGDLNSIGYLDVQFGALDLISDSASFEGVNDTKYSSTSNTPLDNSSTTASSNMDLSATNQSTSLDNYTSQQKSNVQSSISSALSQSLNSSESMPPTSEHLTTTYNTAQRSSGNSAPSATPSAIELNKQDTHSYSQSSTYNTYHPKSSSYQTQSFNSASYSTTQTTNSYASNQQSSNYVNSNTGSSYNPPSGANSYPNAYSSSSYQSNANMAGFPVSMSQPNTYQTSNQPYSQNTSQSVYGANAGLNNSTNYGTATSATPQYNSYNSNTNHKLVKENLYDTGTTTVNSTATSTTIVSTASSALTLTQTTATGTKASTTLAKNSSSIVSNIPPGVAPVMSAPYIMSQGIPYFQQPIYSFEEMQLLQQRLPHMTTPFYEMSYQPPTTLTAVRDGALASYTMSDGRFTRGDSNASPVPSTLSQQTSTLTQGHQAQPMLAQTGPYFFAPYNPMQSYQFGAVYSQLPTATNAHGSSNNTQYPKPGTYGSGYGSSYDALTQSQDYTKGGYVGNTQGQSKGTGANSSSAGSTGNDLSGMYGKSHTAIGKVNSYDKQGFHSGTPPPFSGAVHGSQNAGLAPSGTGYSPVYIPAHVAPHQQHHSTALMHPALHQMDVRHQGRRMDSGNTSGQRSQASNQSKSGAKNYQNSYWNQA